MATREKKLSINRKQNAVPTSPKEVVSPEKQIATMDSVTKQTNVTTKPSPVKPTITKKLIRKAAQNAPRKLVRKNPITMNLKAKNKKATLKINAKVAKTILQNTKILEGRKRLIKNGIPDELKVRKRKTVAGKSDINEMLLSIDQTIDDVINNGEKKPKRKRMTKKGVKAEIIVDKEIKLEIDDGACVNDADAEQIDVKAKKTRVLKKSKGEDETIDEVMNDLNLLINAGEIKQEDVDSMSESSRSDSGKLKKPKKQKQDDTSTEENIENTSNNSNLPEVNIIESLDLNVKKFKSESLRENRRFSVENFPNVYQEELNTPPITIFNNLPRSVSPRLKRAARIRQSIEGSMRGRRSSPYTTRSDSPARLLRNGKHRKLKDINLLEGLDTETKRRRRLCSDLSGSELSVSKLSGYESDSSYSDLASIHGAENSEVKESEPTAEETDTKVFNPAAIKRSDSETGENGPIDTNSNVCDTENAVDINLNDKKPDISLLQAPKMEIETGENAELSSSFKVPEKSIILDSMKQTFNDGSDPEKRRNSIIEPDPTAVKMEHCESNEDDIRLAVEMSPEENVRSPQEDTFSDKESPEKENGQEENKEDVEQDDSKNLSDMEIETATEKSTQSLGDGSISVVDANNLIEGNTKLSESAEELALKENILQALGLQSLKAAEAAKQQKSKDKVVPRTENYTGTLKTVIKINRDKKKGRNSFKMTLQKSKGKGGELDASSSEDGYKIMKDGASSNWKHGNQSSDTAGAHRKSHYSNRSNNMDGSSEHTSDGEVGGQEGASKLLVIPEKASSFSIHPERLCQDECSYCFGKFGLFDTPCHIAQMKSVERQNKILATEKHLTRDSCLCDACYRHVDRKSNTPSYSNKSLKRNSLVAPIPKQDHCHVLGCNTISTNILRRKWIIKMRKSICQVINIDLDNPGLHSIPVCKEHYAALEHLMVCAMCKRRLARNHFHFLGPESNRINDVLNIEGIPLTLTNKPIICKLCKCFISVLLKEPEDRAESTTTFIEEYKKRLLHFNDIVPMDEAAAEEPIIVPSKEKQEPIRRRKRMNKNGSNNEQTNNTSLNSPASPLDIMHCQETDKSDQHYVPSSDSNNLSRSESPSDYTIDYNTLIPAIAMECGSDSESKKEPAPPKKSAHKRLARLDNSVEIIRKSKNAISKSDIAVQRLGSNPSISVRQLFPGEEELSLHANIEFSNVKEKTPEGWEKCSSIIQYDNETKRLWHDLQKPYGNQSSFLRHLILLEKYFRNGDLILSSSASHHSQHYSESVQNRLRAFDNLPSSISYQPIQKAQKSNSGIITSTSLLKHESGGVVSITKNPPPVTISQIPNTSLIPTNASSLLNAKNSKSLGAPPGLISLHPGTNRPVAPLVKVSQSQKIKFPITKNWRPNLIPIDPNKKQEKKGLVQVISGGKPYHITLEDYKKMCAIKRSFEMKQKRLNERLQDAASKSIGAQQSMLKSTVSRNKALNITKTSGNCPNSDFPPEQVDGESILDKLDKQIKQIEKLDAKINDKSAAPLILPKIPKSLTVIPQTVNRKPSRPSSPILLITPKNNSNKS